MEFYLSETHPLLNKENVCLISLLRHKHTKKYVLAANCHILFNINRGDIKTMQICVIRRAVCLLKTELEKQSAGKQKINIIWAGDFNACPNSPIYDVIKSGDFTDCAKYKKFEVKYKFNDQLYFLTIFSGQDKIRI